MDSNSNSIQSGPIPSSSWTRTRMCKYDVFLSFCGTDTRNGFTDHLYAHLIRKGIFAFKDDTRLEKGKPISSQLLQAIQDSRVSIIVFSKVYAASTWCLDEMAAIAKCEKASGQTVFSIFYDVDPSHVRNQSGAYENAFVLHTKKFKNFPDKVYEWKRAMTGLANSVGWDVRDKKESREIEKIVQAVIKTLGHKFSGLADDLIGIQSRVDGLEDLLKLSSEDDDFRVLGIWGMGGIGKTTHATVLYDRISYQFDACCFIENVSKIYRDGGAIAVQKQILHRTLDEKNLDTYSPSEISGIVKNRLSCIKVLIVLDNVDESEQLEKLAISPKLLGTGSRIIITTRDEHILKVYEADAVHKVPPMNNNDSRELFLRNAFKSDDPNSSCLELTPEVLKYVQSLPLAIRVMGSFLRTRNASQWRDALDRLGSYPMNEIMDVLRISFEGLHPEDKEIFLHIACFFEGERVDYVKRILDSCGLHPHIGIPVIIEKSLITIRNQEIHMHEMLQKLGKKIARQEDPDEPGLWSRLWLYKDFHHTLMANTGTKNVKAIVLDQKENDSKSDQLRAEGLSKMTGLRLLILHHKNFSGSFDCLSNSLQYFLWDGYPFASLPLNYESYYNLVELNMPDSNIQQLWQGSKSLPNLKRVDLSNSKCLIETPNFERTPNLQRLDFTGCICLSQVHPSIGLLKELAFLSFRNCSSLVSLDFGTEWNLSSLRVLYLSGCTKLKNTPKFGGLSNLEYLDLEQCISLSKVDQSIGDLAKLRLLSLRHCGNLVSIPSSVGTMTSLKTLDLCGCLELKNLPQRLRLVSLSCASLIFLDVGNCNLREVPDAIGQLRCLERLNLERNNFSSLPFTITLLSSLTYINLSHCHMLRRIPKFPLSGASSGGQYFKTVSGSRNHRSGLYIFHCPRFKLTDNDLSNCKFEDFALSWLIRLVEQPSFFRCGFDIVIPGRVIPKWFNHQFTGGSLIRIVDYDVDDNWIGFAFCVVFELNYHQKNLLCTSSLPHPFYLSFESEHTEERFDMPLRLDLDKVDGSEHLWLIYISQPHCHFMKTGAQITFKADPAVKISNWGLRTVFKQDIEAKKEQLISRRRISGQHVESPNELLKTGEGSNQVDHLLFNYVNKSSSSTSSGPKIQLPYNWLVTEEEENENLEAKDKENTLSNLGLSIRQPL